MNDTLTTRALDHEASARRERLASTLDELSASLTPGRVLAADPSAEALRLIL